MKRSALRADCPPLLALRAHGKTRYAGCARCAQTVAVSQFLMRAARAALKTALLGASRSRRSPRPHSPLQQPGLVVDPNTQVVGERPAVHDASEWASTALP